MHTLEDLGAHSNWIELALIEMGYHNVFPHVGSNTQLVVRGKRIWPLVTGTFGGTDFISSLLGEAGDKLSQVSVTDLNTAVTEAQMANTEEIAAKIKAAMKMFPHSSSSQQVDAMQAQHQQNMSASTKFNSHGAVMSAEEIARQVYPILALKDTISKQIDEMIEKVFPIFRLKTCL